VRDDGSLGEALESHDLLGGRRLAVRPSGVEEVSSRETRSCNTEANYRAGSHSRGSAGNRYDRSGSDA
jgi:hypothetical protein